MHGHFIDNFYYFYYIYVFGLSSNIFCRSKAFLVGVLDDFSGHAVVSSLYQKAVLADDCV